MELAGWNELLHRKIKRERAPHKHCGTRPLL